MTTRGSILVVDDEEDILVLFRACLTRFGFTVLSAKSIEEANQHWESTRDQLCLVIVDVNLSIEGSGLRLLDQWKSRNASIPYLVTSGYLPEMISWHTPLLEGCNFLQKPVSWANLHVIIQQAMCSTTQLQA